MFCWIIKRVVFYVSGKESTLHTNLMCPRGSGIFRGLCDLWDPFTQHHACGGGASPRSLRFCKRPWSARTRAIFIPRVPLLWGGRRMAFVPPVADCR